MSIGILIPSYCPDEAIINLTRTLSRRTDAKVVVVDDGSSDNNSNGIYENIFERIQDQSITVIHHKSNLGKGAAIKTGLKYICDNYPQITGIVTADGDGQHLPQDIFMIASEMDKRKHSLILGTRDLKSEKVPLRSRFGNNFSSIYFRLDTGMKCEDTQTGLRGIPKSLFPLALNTPGERYEYEMNFLTRVAKSDFNIEFIPIETIYEDNNSKSHFRTITDSYLIYKSAFKFAIASLLSAGLDLTIFTILSAVLTETMLYKVALATILARVVSGLFNFTLNYKWSFSGNSESKTGLEWAKYGFLFCAQMVASGLIVYLLSFIPVPLVLIKIITDSGLFVVSYFIQKNWVFSSHTPRRKTLSGDKFNEQN